MQTDITLQSPQRNIIIDAKDLTKTYQMGEVAVHALQGADVAVAFPDVREFDDGVRLIGHVIYLCLP